MGEKINFICLGDRLLEASQCYAEANKLLSLFESYSAVPTEILWQNVDDAKKFKYTWTDFSDLFKDSMSISDIITFYFYFSGFPKKNISLNFSIFNQKIFEINMSIDRKFFKKNIEINWEEIFFKFSLWSTSLFQNSIQACGPELDLYELDDETSITRAAQCWRRDPRMWIITSTERFRGRMEL